MPAVALRLVLVQNKRFGMTPASNNSAQREKTEHHAIAYGFIDFSNNVYIIITTAVLVKRN